MASRNPPPSATDVYEPIRKAIRAEQKDTAREMLRPILTSQPTAEAWYLAAQIASNRAQSVNFLRRALALDPEHYAAKRGLLLLEGAKASVTTMPDLTATGTTAATAGSKARASTSAPSRRWSRIGLLIFMLVLIVALAAFALDAVGVYQGLFTGITIASGGPTPISAINGVPLAQADNAAALAPAAQSKQANSRDADIIENGYLHEYRFLASTAQQITVNVQFYSLAAKRVSHNIAVVGADGIDIFPRCSQTAASEVDTAVNVTCSIVNPGTYLVRVLGRSGESVGAYTIGVQRPE